MPVLVDTHKVGGQTLSESVRSFLANRVAPKADSQGNWCSWQNAKTLDHAKPCGQRVRALAFMLRLKIYELQRKGPRHRPAQIFHFSDWKSQSQKGEVTCPSSSSSEPALSLAFLFLPCIARAQVGLLYSEVKLQGPNVNANSMQTHHYNCCENSIR